MSFIFNYLVLFTHDKEKCLSVLHTLIALFRGTILSVESEGIPSKFYLSLTSISISSCVHKMFLLSLSPTSSTTTTTRVGHSLTHYSSACLIIPLETFRSKGNLQQLPCSKEEQGLIQSIDNNEKRAQLPNKIYPSSKYFFFLHTLTSPCCLLTTLT